MRRVLTGLLLAVLGAGAAMASSPGERRAESRRVVSAFQAELKSALVEALRERGPVGAVAVCSERAPAIARKHEESTGWLEVGRTSLRVRNPANAADAWERAVLREFEERKSQGEPVAELEHAEVVERDGRKVFRYLKAIPTGQPCLTCHGQKVSPELAAEIRTLYPEDRATGFKLGEIRGAFTVTQPLGAGGEH